MNCTETNCINNVKCSFRMEEFMSKNFKIDLEKKCENVVTFRNRIFYYKNVRYPGCF